MLLMIFKHSLKRHQFTLTTSLDFNALADNDFYREKYWNLPKTFLLLCIYLSYRNYHEFNPSFVL